MNAKQIEVTEDEYMDYLDDVYGEIDICGMSYNSSYALKEIDPTAFDQGLAEYSDVNIRYECSKCYEEYDNEEDTEECCNNNE